MTEEASPPPGRTAARRRARQPPCSRRRPSVERTGAGAAIRARARPSRHAIGRSPGRSQSARRAPTWPTPFRPWCSVAVARRARPRADPGPVRFHCRVPQPVLVFLERGHHCSAGRAGPIPGRHRQSGSADARRLVAIEWVARRARAGDERMHAKRVARLGWRDCGADGRLACP